MELCKILIGITVGTNSVSQYSFHADRLLAARIYSARGQRCGKTNRTAILEDEEEIRICWHFSTMETIQLSPQSVPTYSSHFLQVISFGGGKKKPLILDNWLLVTGIRRLIKMPMSDFSHWSRNLEENGRMCPSVDFSYKLLM